MQKIPLELQSWLRLRIGGGNPATWCMRAASFGCDANQSRCAIERIADDRMSQRSHVDANLMRAAGLDTHRDECEAAKRRLNAAQHAIVTDGNPAIVTA